MNGKLKHRLWCRWLREYVAAGVLISAMAVAGESPPSAVSALQAHVKYLASEELEGRGTGTEGNRKAARYIADFFERHGISPLEGNYFQEFTVTTRVKLGKGNEVEIHLRDNKIKWKADRDFRPLPFSRSGVAAGGLVFAGYGITAPDLDFDEYAGIDAEGKVVIVLRGTPRTAAGGADERFDAHAPLVAKMRNALGHGAVGVIFVSPAHMSDELFPLRLMGGGQSGSIIAVHARRDAVNQILPPELPLSLLEEKIRDGKPQSFEIEGAHTTLQTALAFIDEPTANVIGVVPGHDPALAGEYLVVGAHFDHVGRGDRGTSRDPGPPRIHPGADDNASGTAALLEIAARIAARPLRRSVLFMGFSAEELGLLGSRYYVNHPLVPLENTVVMMNLDMVGRMENNFLRISGTGTSPLWEPLVDSLSAVYGLSVAKSPGGRGPSDYTPFYDRGIPVINFFSGLHPDYHRPGDTWEKLNYAGIEKVVHFAVDVLERVGNREARPVFVAVPSGATPAVFLGVTADPEGPPRGVRVGRVVPGSPAEQSGLLSGDVIIRIGPAAVSDFDDLVDALRQYQPADTTEVEILRGDSEAAQRLRVVLRAR